MSLRRRAPVRKVLRGEERIHSVVRIRPTDGEACALHYNAERCMVEGMAFDDVFLPNVSQEEVFLKAALPTVDAWIDGFHGCVFAYGQTGSGKTHTMLGPDGGKGSLSGIIPLSVEYALRRLAEEQMVKASIDKLPSQFRLQASFFELYNDELRDLLSESKDATSLLAVREDEGGFVYVEGATTVTVTSPQDVARLVVQGSRRRATGRTNMNLHSSRSHAIFVLHLQHRWQDEKCLASGNPRLFKMQTSVLHLVDLAGSEYAKRTGNTGEALRESIAINTGLFALGNVISALAGHSERCVGGHIPFRDSTLTRLLQSSLGGDGRALMIVCVSPAEENLAESIGALNYGAAARSIQTAAVAHVAEVVEPKQPLDDDFADPEDFFDRRCLWINTNSYGDVYCRAVGDPANPLILFVHGSGPTNSSTYWNSTIFNLAVRSEVPYFYVAVDCPGYGRTPGDRQVIRSYPGSFVNEVVTCLGKSAALCLVGSSQGCCAVFNAVLEYPSITQYVAVMDPVGHDVFRYRAIQQHCLLTFDIEDDGHPVKVGRWMRDNLPHNTYFEFASSQEPFWHADHFAVEILRMVQQQHPASSCSLLEAVYDSTRAAVTRLAAGILGWAEHGGFGEPIKEIAAGIVRPLSHEPDVLLSPEMRRQLTVSSESVTAEPVGTVWRAALDPKAGRVCYVCDDTGESVWKRPTNCTILQEGHEGVGTQPPQGQPKPDLFDEGGRPAQAKQEETSEEKLAKREAELRELQCLLCGAPLYQPQRMAKCRHVLCRLCWLRTSRYSGQCHVCGKKSQTDPGQEDHQQRLDAAHIPGYEDAQKRLEDYMTSSAQCLRLVLEYGNTATPDSGAAHAVEAFLRPLRTERGGSVKKNIDLRRSITRVEFDINPDFPKSAVRVNAPPFILQRTMASLFPCDMTVTFEPTLCLPPLRIPYTISHSPSSILYVVLVIPQQLLGIPKKGKVLPVVANTTADSLEVLITNTTGSQ